MAVGVGTSGVEAGSRVFVSSTATGVEGSEPLSLGYRDAGRAGDLLDGSVLLLWTPELEVNAGVVGLGTAPE